MAKRKQRMVIENSDLGPSKALLVDRDTGRLSTRQVRETFKALAFPGHQWAGKLGEWPLTQYPLGEGSKQGYRIVEHGKPDASARMSNLYLLPLAAADALEKQDAAAEPQAA